MKKIILLFILISGMMAQKSYAQIEVIGSENYGRINNIIYDRTTENKLYALTNGNHILVSVDNGKTWDILYSMPIEEGSSIQKMQLADNNTALSFVKFAGLTPYNKIAFLDIASGKITKEYSLPNAEDKATVAAYSTYPKNSDVALVNTTWRFGESSLEVAGTAFYTTDGGKNWKEVYNTIDSQNIFINNVAINPANPNKLFLARHIRLDEVNGGYIDGCGGVLRSDDGGNTWTKSLANNTFSAMAFNPSDSNDIFVGTYMMGGAEELYRSKDGGKTWNIVPINFTDMVLDCINAIEFNPANPDKIIILEENEIIISDDNGLTWENHVYATNEDIHSYYYGINASCNPFSEDEVFLSADYCTLFSEDGGATTEWVKNPYFISSGQVRYFSNGNEEHIYFGVQQGSIHKNMATGEENDINILPVNMTDLTPGTTVYVDDSIAGRVYTFSDESGPSLKLSNDFGKTLTTLHPSTSNDINCIGIDPNNRDVIWASFSTFFENAKLTKIDFSNPLNVKRSSITLPAGAEDVINGIYVFPENSDHVLLTLGAQIAKTTDGGKNWSLIRKGLESLTVLQELILSFAGNPLNENQFAITSTQGVFISNDKGENWSKVSDKLMHHIKFSTVTDGVIMATTYNTLLTNFSIHISLNAGASWAEIPDDNLEYIIAYSSDFKFYEDKADVFVGSKDLGLVKYTVDFSELPVGTEPVESDVSGNGKHLRIYPNPAVDKVFISTRVSVKNYGVFGIDGRLMIEGNTNEVNVASLPSGIYMIKVLLFDGKMYWEKIVKK